MLEKISLKERLRRLEAGYASSPCVTELLAETFCNTPVVPVLEGCDAFYERERLCELLRSETLRAHLSGARFDEFRSWGIEDVTYGDLALLIAAHYLGYATTSAETIEALTIIYFYCIEALVMDPKLTRETVKPCLHPIYDFLHMSFIEYHTYARRCGLDKYTDKIDAFCAAMGLSSRMTPVKIFEELKMPFWSSREACFDFAQTTLPTLAQCEHFIDFFVCPTAMIYTFSARAEKEKEAAA